MDSKDIGVLNRYLRSIKTEPTHQECTTKPRRWDITCIVVYFYSLFCQTKIRGRRERPPSVPILQSQCKTNIANIRSLLTLTTHFRSLASDVALFADNRFAFSLFHPRLLPSRRWTGIYGSTLPTVWRHIYFTLRYCMRNANVLCKCVPGIYVGYCTVYGI